VYLVFDQKSTSVFSHIRSFVLGSLVFEGNAFMTGSIPTTIGLLTKLTELRLFITGHTGTIPTEIGLNTRLEQLVIGSNNMSGTVPATIGNLSALKLLNIEFTDIVGTLPETICPRASSSALDVLLTCPLQCNCCRHQCFD
jgi:hypothetical protein